MKNNHVCLQASNRVTIDQVIAIEYNYLMTMTDVPLGITEFDDFVHTTYLYKSKEPNNKMLILKFVIKKSSI